MTANLPPRYGTSRVESFTDVVDVPISSNSTDNLNSPVRGFISNGTGDMKVVMASGHERIIPSVQAGVVYPFFIFRVVSDGATDSSHTAVAGGY